MWFWKRSRPAAPPLPKLRLEQLESRTVPSVVYNGGALLAHVEVQGVYYGSNWGLNATLSGQTGQLEGYLNYIVQSPYADMLTRAGYNVGRGSFDHGVVVNLSYAADTYVEDGTIRQNLQTGIHNGSLKSPDANRLYVVYVEPDVAVRLPNGSTSRNAFLGYHNYFTGSDAYGRPAPVYYAVIPYPGWATNNGYAYDASVLHSLTAVSSHELAEAITDPVPGAGWYDRARGEVGDITAGQVVLLNGYEVQKIADKNDRAMTPAVLTASGQAVTATAGRAFSGAVATGADATLVTRGSDLAATIDWGDGTTSTGSVGDDGAGHFPVSGSHTYTRGGTFTVRVSLQDRTNSLGTASATASAAVSGSQGGTGGDAFVVGQFNGAGVWRYSALHGWRQLTGSNASSVAVDDRGDTVAAFPGAGVWRFEDAIGWQQLTPATPSQVSIAGDGIVAAEFGGLGVWRCKDGVGWQQLTGSNASSLAVDASGDVVGEFAGLGVWRYKDGVGWQQLAGNNASQVSIAGNGIVAAEFAGLGVWRYKDGAGWQQLAGNNASSLAVDASGDVVVEFAGLGVWRYKEGAGWQQLTSSNATQVAIDASGNVTGEFAGLGVWRHRDDTGWAQLTGSDASRIGA